MTVPAVADLMAIVDYVSDAALAMMGGVPGPDRLRFSASADLVPIPSLVLGLGFDGASQVLAGAGPSALKAFERRSATAGGAAEETDRWAPQASLLGPDGRAAAEGRELKGVRGS